MDIEGTTALVTGAGKRLGKTMALKLAEAGADLVIHYNRSRSEAEETAEEARSLGRRAWTESFDLTDTRKVGPWMDGLIEKVGGVDILINSASLFPETHYKDLDSTGLTESMDLHVLSPLALIQSLAKQERPTTAINILDTRIADRDYLHAAYHLAKRSLFTITKDLAASLAPGTRVNGVAPGVILPPPGKDEAYLQSLADSNPMKAIGTAHQVAEAACFLIRNDFITGQVIYVDGGRHLKGSAYGL